MNAGQLIQECQRLKIQLWYDDGQPKLRLPAKTTPQIEEAVAQLKAEPMRSDVIVLLRLRQEGLQEASQRWLNRFKQAEAEGKQLCIDCLEEIAEGKLCAVCQDAKNSKEMHPDLDEWTGY